MRTTQFGVEKKLENLYILEKGKPRKWKKLLCEENSKNYDVTSNGWMPILWRTLQTVSALALIVRRDYFWKCY